jgi:hypothetical protein
MSIATVTISSQLDRPQVVTVAQGPRGPAGAVISAYGQASRTTDGNVTIVTAGTYVEAADLTLDSANTFGMLKSGSYQSGLSNNSGATRTFQIYASIDATANNNNTLGIRLAKNGTAIAQTECRAQTSGSGHESKLVTSWLVSLAANDSIHVLVTNFSATGTLTVKRGRIVAHALT